MPPASERIATLETNHRTMASQLERIDRSLHGTADSPGLITRVDRLEQSRLTLVQQIALYIAAIGALAALLQAFWTR